MLIAKPFQQGKLTVITGPVNSDKTKIITSFLDAAVDSGYKDQENILVFRHPDDDQEPGSIGRHKADVALCLEDIFRKITSQTRTVIIAGASHYRCPKILDLADAIVRSDRNLIISGLNLDAEGKPYGYMPGLITLADEIILAKSICTHKSCRSTEANRSISKGGEYAAVCAHHFSHDCPPISMELSGFLKLYLGSMYSGKTTGWGSDLKKIKEVGWKPIVLKYLHDDRYGEKNSGLFSEGNVTLHSENKIPSVLVDSTEHIRSYLEDHPETRLVFINEGQFFKGLYGLVSELIPKGYRFHIDSLLRGFNRKRFGESADLACLADVVNIYYGTCVECGHPATENQRMKKVGGVIIPSNYHDPLEAIGGKDDGKAEYFYQARCLKDWVLEGEPELIYSLEKFSWP